MCRCSLVLDSSLRACNNGMYNGYSTSLRMYVSVTFIANCDNFVFKV